MPIYEYRCPDCGHEFERLQSYKDPAVTDCPSCSGGQVKKLISKTSFALKGGGWYKDHYGLKSGGGASSGDSGGSSKSDSSSKSGAGSAAAPAPSSASTAGDA
jgi:putative FmdB family regulatory protein